MDEAIEMKSNFKFRVPDKNERELYVHFLCIHIQHTYRYPVRMAHRLVYEEQGRRAYVCSAAELEVFHPVFIKCVWRGKSMTTEMR
jgi:hypothetical protein